MDAQAYWSKTITLNLHYACVYVKDITQWMKVLFNYQITKIKCSYNSITYKNLQNENRYSYNLSQLCFMSLVVCPCVLYILAIVLSFLIQYTDYDYPFAIFKLFWYCLL